jgi:hypothetical protein
MKLSERQGIFALNVSKLLQWIFQGTRTCTLGEAWRTEEQAKYNEEHGLGIANSLHRSRLAIDLNLFKDGILLENLEDYREAGEYWKTLHIDNNWGGDFKKRKDPYHFSMSDGLSNTK